MAIVTEILKEATKDRQQQADELMNAGRVHAGKNGPRGEKGDKDAISVCRELRRLKCLQKQVEERKLNADEADWLVTHSIRGEHLNIFMKLPHRTRKMVIDRSCVPAHAKKKTLRNDGDKPRHATAEELILQIRDLRSSLSKKGMRITNRASTRDAHDLDSADADPQ